MNFCGPRLPAHRGWRERSRSGSRSSHFGLDAIRRADRPLPRPRRARASAASSRRPRSSCCAGRSLGIGVLPAPDRRRQRGTSSAGRTRRWWPHSSATGRALVSSTRLHGRYAVRLCVINHTSAAEDVEQVLDWFADAASQPDPLESPPRRLSRPDSSVQAALALGRAARARAIAALPRCLVDSTEQLAARGRPGAARSTVAGRRRRRPALGRSRATSTSCPGRGRARRVDGE